MAHMGNNGFFDVIDSYDFGDEPMDQALAHGPGILHKDVKLLTPRLVAEHNGASYPINHLPVSDSTIYLTDCSINFSENRRILLRFNDVLTGDVPSVCVFDTDDCSPLLMSSNASGWAVHVLTRVEFGSWRVRNSRSR